MPGSIHPAPSKADREFARITGAPVNAIWHIINGERVWWWRDPLHVVGMCADLAVAATLLPIDLSPLTRVAQYAAGDRDASPWKQGPQGQRERTDFETLGNHIQRTCYAVETACVAVQNHKDDDGSLSVSAEAAISNALGAGVPREQIASIIATWWMRDAGLVDDQKHRALCVGILKGAAKLLRELLGQPYPP